VCGLEDACVVRTVKPVLCYAELRGKHVTFVDELGGAGGAVLLTLDPDEAGVPPCRPGVS